MPSTLQSLTALAAEKSSDKRRVLLREVTDLFFETSDQDRSAQESEDFDVILSSVSQEMAEEVRIELAERFADTPDAPYRLVRQLASDEQISVAGKVLRKSFALKDHDLVTIAHSRGQEHLLAIAGREYVPEAVSDAVVQRGDEVVEDGRPSYSVELAHDGEAPAVVKGGARRQSDTQRTELAAAVSRLGFEATME